MTSAAESAVAAVQRCIDVPCAIRLPDTHTVGSDFVVVQTMAAPVEVTSIRPSTVTVTVHAATHSRCADLAETIWNTLEAKAPDWQLFGVTPSIPPTIRPDPDNPRQARWQLTFTATHIPEE